MYLNWHVNKFWTTSNKPFSESFAFHIDTLGIYGDNQSTQRVRIKSSCLEWMKWLSYSEQDEGPIIHGSCDD